MRLFLFLDWYSYFCVGLPAVVRSCIDTKVTQNKRSSPFDNIIDHANQKSNGFARGESITYQSPTSLLIFSSFPKKSSNSAHRSSIDENAKSERESKFFKNSSIKQKDSSTKHKMVRRLLPLLAIIFTSFSRATAPKCQPIRFCPFRFHYRWYFLRKFLPAI